MGLSMRPERREWGPSIDITNAELVADVFRGLQDLVGDISVSVMQYGSESEIVSITISVLGWARLDAWLAALDDVTAAVLALRTDGWLSSEPECIQAVELLASMRGLRHAWSAFTDPDAPDLLELVADL